MQCILVLTNHLLIMEEIFVDMDKCYVEQRITNNDYRYL